MGTWLAIVALLLIGGYSAWTAIDSVVVDRRLERPRLTYGESIAKHRHGWAATATAFGAFAVVLLAGGLLIGVTQAPVLLALTGIERFTFPIAVAAFAALFFGARLLFRRYLGKRWVQQVIALGSIIIGIGLVFFALSLAY
jgi:hypothetical protein